MNKKTWGGSGRGQGRKPLPGYEKTTKARFVDEQEEKLWNSLSPRERVEIVLEWLKERNDET